MLNKTPDYQKPNFEEIFDIEKEIHKYNITDLCDIKFIMDCFEHCKSETNNFPPFENLPLHEGSTKTLLKKMREHFEVWKEGGIIMPFTMIAQCGTTINTPKGKFISAINAKLYKNEDYEEAIKQYNKKRGITLSNLLYTADMSVNDINEACKNLKTYTTEQVFPAALFKY